MNRKRNLWLGRFGIAAALLVAFFVGLSLRGSVSHPSEHATESPQPSTWTCSMHPQIQMPDQKAHLSIGCARGNQTEGRAKVGKEPVPPAACLCH